MNESKDNTHTIGSLVVKMLKADGYFERLAEWKSNLPVFLNSLGDLFAIEHELTKKVLTILAQNGWYISSKMTPSLSAQLAQKIQSKNVKQADKLMCRFYKKHLREIQSDISKVSPSRSFILKKAFFAHKKRDYELSVPVFLAQADGICQELSGYQLYKKSKRGTPLIAKFVEQLKSDSHATALLEPLRVSVPISESTKTRRDLSTLNRHGILHGIDVNYASETNSYKAVSLLAYVSSILIMAKKS